MVLIKRYTKVYVLIINIILLIFCSKKEGEDYFPMSKGMRWEYSVQMLVPLVGTVKGKAICRVDGIENIKGKKYFKLVFVPLEIPGAETEIEYCRKTKHGIYIIDSKYMDRPEELDIPFPTEIGSSWMEQIPIEGEFKKFNCRIEGFETLTLIDKEYKNCLKIRREAEGWMEKIEIIEYYAVNVGLVKSIFKGNGAIMEINLEKYHRK